MIHRLAIALKAFFCVLLSGVDCIHIVEQIYAWTQHPESSWGKDAKRLLDTLSHAPKQ